MDAIILKTDNSNSETTFSVFKKDDTFVDFIQEGCIMSYLQAAQEEKKLAANYKNLQVITLKDLILNKDLIPLMSILGIL
jgi:hypothetical protein